jgi:hypothetical protein
MLPEKDRRQQNLPASKQKRRKKTEMPISSDVESVFNSYPREMRPGLLHLRRLIFETAAAIKDVGRIEETLKWGEPSYITLSKSGSTIRIAWKEKKEKYYSIFFKCTANLVPAFKERFPQTFNFSENRSIDFALNSKVPEKELKQCIALALTYHHNKKLATADRWALVEKFIK